MSPDSLRSVRQKLLDWYDGNRRDLPWRSNRNPYRVWVSEVMLQQTRVATAIPYYDRFLRLFPSVEALAMARPQSVLRAWAGLGYYSRARALQAAARLVCLRGSFPRTYEGWLKLPGVGPYTAAAIASIALGQPHAAVDGNVRRVLSRLWPGGSLQEKAEGLLDRTRPGDFNQALMELGATVCVPRDPLCGQCPVREECQARRKDGGASLPAAKPARLVQHLRMRLALVERDGRILLARPTGRGLWPRFWSLPRLPHPALRRADRLAEFRHTVTYRNIRVEVFRAQLATEDGAAEMPDGLRFVKRSWFSRLPLSTPSRKALQTH